MVLVCPAAGDCRKEVILDQAAQRGFVVLATKSADVRIAPRPEVDFTRVGTLIVTLASLEVEVPPPAAATAQPSSPSKRILPGSVARKRAAGAPDGTVLKLYSPNKKGLLPDEAYRDAVEWLAGEFGVR